MGKKKGKKTTKKSSKKSQNDTKAKKEEIKETDSSVNDETHEITEQTDTPSYTPPEPVKRVIEHPKADVVKAPDPDLDEPWGFAIEFTSAKNLEPVWKKLKKFLDKNEHPVFGKAKWLSLDPRGYFSPRLRHFITITGYGMQIENIPEWFKKNIGEIKKPAKIIEPSEELADDAWQGYIEKDKIELSGSKYIKVENYSRKKRKLEIEAKKPVSDKIPRYWTEHAVFTARDYLIPFVTKEKYESGIREAESYLEEYIVEQIEWEESESNQNDFVILPDVFKSDKQQSRGIEIPEEYTPEIDYSNMGGMFPGMGGMGGMPDFNLNDLGGSDDDFDDSNTESDESTEKSSDSSEPDVIDAEVVEEKKN